MTHITNTSAIHRTNLSRFSQSRESQLPQTTHTPQETRTLGTDQVQISDAARRLDAQNTGAPFRAELVERVRSEIASGQYDQNAKLDLAIDSLLGDLS